MISFLWLEIQVVPVCLNGSFGSWSTQWHWKLSQERRGNRASEQGSRGTSPTWNKWVHLGQGAAWAQELLEPLTMCAACQPRSSK